MALIVKTKQCTTCRKQYLVYYDRGETDDKPCPYCNGDTKDKLKRDNS